MKKSRLFAVRGSQFAIPDSQLSRRDFLKLAALGLGALAFTPGWLAGPAYAAPTAALGIPEFPEAELLGRVAQGVAEVKARPELESQTITTLYEDAVFPWLGETTSAQPAYVFNNQKWVQMPDGYIYAPMIQPVHNRPNKPVSSLRQTSLGPGMWVEVTVPYVDTIMQNKPSSGSWVEARVEEGRPVRFYYGQVFWVDTIKKNDQGQALYRVNPNYYGGVDLLWAAAEAFRPIRDDELTPIHPEAADKRVVVDVTYQTLSCLEGDREVYFCRVSTGAKYDMNGNVVDKWSTPVGEHTISRKFISLQMSGGTTGAGYDLPGIGWVTIFATGGVALHSTVWHNNFGDAMSHGCVNMLPEDAKWVFRWTLPNVPYDPGMVDSTLTGQASTKVMVIEA
jgi:lipoprotein-anchoring transpeptidase ErfK/SrfK